MFLSMTPNLGPSMFWLYVSKLVPQGNANESCENSDSVGSWDEKSRKLIVYGNTYRKNSRRVVFIAFSVDSLRVWMPVMSPTWASLTLPAKSNLAIRLQRPYAIKTCSRDSSWI